MYDYPAPDYYMSSVVRLHWLGILAVVGPISSSNATVRIHIDLSTQRMQVESSSGSFNWPVSTARSGYHTPRGYYAPTGMQRMHYSQKYDMTPMPYSIFFRGGYAIHGSYAMSSLGRPASHGCVRLAPSHAAQLYQMVQTEGARISITGRPPAQIRYASAHNPAGAEISQGYSGRRRTKLEEFPLYKVLFNLLRIDF